MKRSNIYRYPGAQPFSSQQRNLFFARDEDISKLLRLIRLESTVVLFSKSGLGKSSLINAGVLPLLEQQTQLKSVPIRFGAAASAGSKTPALLTQEYIAKLLPAKSNNFLEKLQPGDRSIWRLLKNHQIQAPESSGFWLVFDQSEELFTYPATEVELFKLQLADALNSTIPSRYRKALENHIDDLSDAELEQINKPFELKILFAIRSDRLSLLDQMKDYFPDILVKTYELKPLSAANAREAIVKPATLKGDGFASPPFIWNEDALAAVLDFLTSNGSRSIESFQLQILCQYVEQLVINRKLTSVSLADIGDISNIYNNYYLNQIGQIKDEDARRAARHLIEDGLILEEEERRLSLYEGQIERDYKVSGELLAELVAAHLLRAEPSPDGGYMYELTHDSLVAPVLRAKKERREAEERAEAERLEAEARAEEERERLEKIQRQRQRRRRLFISAAATVLSVAGAFSGYSAWRVHQANVELKDYTTRLEEAVDEANRLSYEQERANERLQNKQDSIDQLLNIVTQAGQGQNALEILSKMAEEARAKQERNQFEQSKRGPLVMNLFSADESTRRTASNQLIGQFKNDPELATDIAKYSIEQLSKGTVEINSTQWNAAFNVIYILDAMGTRVSESQESKAAVTELLNLLETIPAFAGSGVMKTRISNIRGRLS